MAKGRVIGGPFRPSRAARFEAKARFNSMNVRDVLENVQEALDQVEVALNLLGYSKGEGAVQGPPLAFEAFMARLEEPLRACGGRLRMSRGTGFVKFEGVTGHRVYVARAKREVGRVDSTLPPESVPGAKTPGFRNGRIASWLPPDPELVGRALRLIAGVPPPDDPTLS